MKYQFQSSAMSLSTFLKSSKNVIPSLLLAKRSLHSQAAKCYYVFEKSFASKRCSGIVLRCHSTLVGKRLTKFYKRDRIPEDFELVYRNPSTNYINLAQISSVVIAITSCVLLFVIPSWDKAKSDAFGPQTKAQAIMGFSLIFLTCAGLQYIGYKSPIRMYTDGRKFIMVRYGILGWLQPTRKTEFKAGAGCRARPSYLSLVNDHRYTINGTVYMIFDHHFRSNADYHLMMGSR